MLRRGDAIPTVAAAEPSSIPVSIALSRKLGIARPSMSMSLRAWVGVWSLNSGRTSGAIANRRV